MKHIWSPDIPGQPRRLHVSGAAKLKGINFEQEHPVLRFVAADEDTTYELSIEDDDSVQLLLFLAKQLKDRKGSRRAIKPPPGQSQTCRP